MRVDAAETGSLRGGRHDMCHTGRAQRPERSDQANENGAALRSGRSLTKISGDRVADIGREGHALDPLPLAAHDDLTRAPPQVVETQGRHFDRTQPETGQCGDHRKVSRTSDGTRLLIGHVRCDRGEPTPARKRESP